MSLATVYSRAKLGIDAPLVTVEVHLSGGLPSVSIVGLPEAAVKESRDRVRGAIKNCKFFFPDGRVIINLAPADLPKDGGRYDLAIAIATLIASEQAEYGDLDNLEILGELALSGDLRPVQGALPAALACGAAGRTLIVTAQSGPEAALGGSTTVLAATTLRSVCAHLNGRQPLPAAQPLQSPPPKEGPDLQDVKGQAQAKRALEVAACGGHNLIFYGPPGTGKTMLATRMTGLLPPLSNSHMLEVASINSAAGLASPRDWHQRPFRAPHHTASGVALVGGGSNPRPGEISLAHRGVLFLDELPEFQRQVLEVLREPLESGEIRISRARAQVTFPAAFQLIAAMNPCPCGHYGDRDGRCRCTPDQVRQYRSRISGPLLDRIDMHLPVNPLPKGEIYKQRGGESSDTVRQRVIQIHQRQQHRQGKPNAALGTRELEAHCQLRPQQTELLDQALERLGLSARALHRVLKVARTLADIEGTERLENHHITEAIGYRNLDRGKQFE